MNLLDKLARHLTIVPTPRERIMKREIDRLRQLIMDDFHNNGFNDATVERWIGVDPTGFHDEWPNLPDRPCYTFTGSTTEDIDYTRLTVPLFRREMYFP